MHFKWPYTLCFVVVLGISQAAYADLDRAAAWLESQQDISDGSWPGSSEGKTFLQTAEAVLALHAANRRATPYFAGQTWIENHDPENLDARARRLRVLYATDSSIDPDVSGLIVALNTPVTGQAGWGLAQRYRASPLDTALALEALRTADASFSSGLVIAYLKATQLTATGEKGWPAAGGTTADPYTTARVVSALALYKDSDSTLTTPLNNAVATLQAKVTTSSSQHIKAATAIAYLRMNPASSSATTLINSLVTQQQSDGSFSGGILTTALAAQAFAVANGNDTTYNRTRVDVPDANLRRAINLALGRGALDQLNRGELALLTTLNINSQDVSSLAGLEYATNLTTLNATYNNITDTSPIAGLTQLTTINLQGNPCAGCTVADTTDHDVPIPLWALLGLGGLLMSIGKRLGLRPAIQ